MPTRLSYVFTLRTGAASTAVPLGPDAADVTLDSFVRRHGQALFGLAYTLSGSREEAEDIVQSVLVRLAGRELSVIEDLNAYARRAVCNEAASIIRRLKLGHVRRRSLIAEWERDMRVQPDPYGRIEVLSALASLSVRQRSAIVLRYYVSLTDSEIADALDCAPATVRTLLSRGIRTLRRELERQK